MGKQVSFRISDLIQHLQLSLLVLSAVEGAGRIDMNGD